MTASKWQIKQTDANLALMAKTLGISEITSNVMANRNIRSKNTALAFLSPSIDRLGDTLQMKGAEETLARISSAMTNREKIVIYGDYDVDGITSTAILHKVLTRLGANCSYYIPHRMEEGYGLTLSTIEKLAEEGTELIVAVDNGISAVAEIEAANEKGISTVIIDHHEPGGELPPAAGIVDPKQPGCPYPFKELCAAGLAYKMAEALCEYIDTPFVEQDEMLVLAAIGTLCDIVDLTDENRSIVNCGLTILNANKLINPGLGSLLTMRGYLDKPIDAFTIGFIVGPCINAAGRLESASLAMELLLAEDFSRRMELVYKLAELNEERKALTTDCVERLMAEIDQQNLDKILVLTDTQAHESIAGIAAGRIREATNRPTIVLTSGDGAMKGSARSIPSFDIFQALSTHRKLFQRFGGHAMAAGLTLDAENIPMLRHALNHECNLTEDDFCPVIHIDRELSPDDVTLHLSGELSRLAPFGKGNEEPLFASRELFAQSVRVIDDKNTLIFTFYSTTDKKIKGIAFGLNEIYAQKLREIDALDKKHGGLIMDVVYAIETNVYNGASSVQMRVRDFVVRDKK